MTRILFLCLILTSGCSGCTSQPSPQPQKQPFTWTRYISAENLNVVIMKDDETGCEYIIVQGPAITPRYRSANEVKCNTVGEVP